MVRKPPPLPVWIFILIRAVLLLALPFEGLRGYGDHVHFFNLAALPGLPYLHYWAEFPPVFPFLSELLYTLSGGVEHVYSYLLIFLLTLADLGSLLLFLRLSRRIDASDDPWRGLLYAALLGGLAYTWWYFDSLAVFLTLLAAQLALSNRKGVWGGLALGLGILTKLFPALLLPALWKFLPRKRAITITIVSLALTLLVYGGLWLASPEFTSASLRSQSAKGSWETAWALLDGNWMTGNFGPESERLDPATALLPRGNPPVINSWLRLAVFAAAGLVLFLRSRLDDPRRALAFAGLTWAVFLLWSPGWSVQWLLYLIPLILLTLPQRLAVLLGAALVFANLLEWPVLLSRGMFSMLPLTILLRTLLLVLLAVVWWQESQPEMVSRPAT
jgi:hypothetical protein